jgi:4-coumarate--CoA ligase
MPHVFVLSFVDPLESSEEPSAPAPISRSFSFSPIYWGTGLMSMILSAFNPGETRIVTMNSFSVDLCAEMIEKYHPTSVQLNPASMLPFLNSNYVNTLDFTSVKMFMCSGSIVNEELRKKFKSIFPEKPFVIFYGMTECPVSSVFPGANYEGLTVGKIVSSIYLKIVDDDGNKLDNGKKGEIRVKFEFGFAGYFNNPTATAEALDDEGYFKTGDVGYIDDGGNIFILDRNKDIFKYKGYHVSEEFKKIQ